MKLYLEVLASVMPFSVMAALARYYLVLFFISSCSTYIVISVPFPSFLVLANDWIVSSTVCGVDIFSLPNLARQVTI